MIAKKLTGECQPEELRELENYLRKNPDLHYSMQTIMDLWRAEQNHLDQEESHDAFNKHIEKMNALGIDFSLEENPNLEDSELPNNKKRKLLIWGTPVLLALIGIAFFSTNLFRSTMPSELSGLNTTKKPHQAVSEVATKNGSKTNMILPDGTKVWLNAGSNLTYDSSYGKSIREVALSGEGFFDVVKNKEKPFIIHASNVNIKVLGTEFDVKSYPSDKTTEASLIRGSIEVTFKDKPNKKVILKPNEKIVVDNDKKIESIVRDFHQDKTAKVNAIADGFAVKNLTYEAKTGTVIETSWVDNKLIFQDESFEDIAKQLERWYGVSIRFQNSELKENHLTGSFRNETVKQALDALKFTAAFNYSIDNNNDIIIY